MTIRIKCPHCHKTLGVKDHLAGKKVACPICKNALKIPAPVSAAADVEDLAAAAFADAPKPAQPARENKPIEFTCVFCEAAVRVPFELGGKQAPCPECKRIVKVPKPVEDKPKDWRAVDARQVPSFARGAEPQAPEGAWAPATARKVSQQALAEAGAVPEVEAEPVGIGVWIRRGVYAAAAVALLALTWTYLANRKHESTGREGLTRALEFIEPKSKLGPEATAALHRAAGEFYVHKTDPKEKALGHFGNSRGLLGQLPSEGPAAIERDALLRDLALAWVDLGGAGKEVEEGKRVAWENVQKELERTLSLIKDADARAVALRDVVTLLLGKGKGGDNAALTLAIKMDDKSQQVALLMARGKAEDAANILPRPAGDDIDGLVRLAYSEGLAREGKYPDALELANKKGPPLERLQALLAVAGAALGDRNQASRADSARPAVEAAFDLAWIESKKGLKIPPWQLIELGCVAARTGLDDRVQQVLTRLPHKTAKGRVQLDQVLAKLDASPGFVDPTAVPLPEKESVFHGLALEALARHNTRIGKHAEVLDSVENLEENLRPFVLVGVALGELDANQR